MRNWLINEKGYVSENREIYLNYKTKLKLESQTLNDYYYHLEDNSIKTLSEDNKWIPLKYFKWDYFIRKYYNLNTHYIRTTEGLYLLKTKYFYVLFLESINSSFLENILFCRYLYEKNNLNLPLIMSLSETPSFTYHRVLFKFCDKIKIKCILLKDKLWFVKTSLMYNKFLIELIRENNFINSNDELTKILRDTNYVEVCLESIKDVKIERPLKKINFSHFKNKNLHKRMSEAFFL